MSYTDIGVFYFPFNNYEFTVNQPINKAWLLHPMHNVRILTVTVLGLTAEWPQTIYTLLQLGYKYLTDGTRSDY